MSRKIVIEEQAVASTDPTSSVEVTKNTRGYNWTIKLYFKGSGRGGNKAREAALKAIQQMDAEMRLAFGGEE